MDNIYRYMRECGSLPFSKVPMNEADNLVFSVYCYLDIAEVIPGPDGGEIRLEDAARRYFKKHGIPKTSLDDGSTSSDALQHTFLRMAGSKRYRDMMLSSYTDIVLKENAGEFSALCIRYDPAHVYVAYRGTSDRLSGWKEDFYLMASGRIPSQKYAAAYLRAAAKRYPDCFLEPGGHSKGGYFAVYAAAAAPPALQERITAVWSNDGQCLAPRYRSTPGYRVIAGKIRYFVPAASLASMIYPHEENYTVVDSCARGLLQHDAKTWRIRDGHFVVLNNRSGRSIRLERKFVKWFRQFSPDEQLHFTEIFFDVLYASGAETFPEMKNFRKDALKRCRAKMRTLPAKDRRWIWRFLFLLGQAVVFLK